jgi:hypothetical protein
MVIGVYSINVSRYGVYVCTSNDIERSLKKHYSFLQNGVHHNYVLQRLYNLYPDYFSTKDILEVDHIEKINFIAGLYRLKFPFTLDSFMRYQVLDKWYIIHKYRKHPELYIYVDEDKLAHIFDANNLRIGIELGDNFETGRYIHNQSNTLRKVQ